MMLPLETLVLQQMCVTLREEHCVFMLLEIAKGGPFGTHAFKTGIVGDERVSFLFSVATPSICIGQTHSKNRYMHELTEL